MKMKNIARLIPSGWIYMIVFEVENGDIILTVEEFEALCEERAQIVDGKVVML